MFHYNRRWVYGEGEVSLVDQEAIVHPMSLVGHSHTHTHSISFPVNSPLGSSERNGGEMEDGKLRSRWMSPSMDCAYQTILSNWFVDELGTYLSGLAVPARCGQVYGPRIIRKP
jgi:hypothetical protein